MGAWDWIHAGLELGTYLQAKHAQQQLSDIKTAAEVGLAQQALLAAMRNFIFDVYRDIQLAEEQLERFPQQVYIVSKTLERRLVDSGLSPEMFPDFHDKEFVLKVGKKVVTVAKRAKERLSRAQVQQSAVAVKYIAEMPILQQAIMDRYALESLWATEKEWTRLRKHQGSRNLFVMLAVLGLGSFLCGGIPLGIGGLEMMMERASFGAFVVGMIFVGLAGAMGVGEVIFLLRIKKSNPKYKALKTKREEWQKMLISREERSEYVSLFGDLSNAQLRAVYKKRLAFLEPLLGRQFQQYLVFKKQAELSLIHI